ncbi:L,D-transpeptidase family protein [Leisingera caerulea]
MFIHGQPNAAGNLITLPGDWTAGCIAVSNQQMETLWRLTQVGTEVEIRP